jgi:ubiquinone/menaquinone biosynthesis C-methylase UbiE
MLLNRVEKMLMNNPVRAAIQRHYEVPRLLAMGGGMAGGLALEVGCGRGMGVESILDDFGADRVDAFDLDPEMVALAKPRLASRGDRVRVWTGDVTRIDAPDGAYDAIFDFGIVHHVPNWPAALAEIARVLRPGGRLYAEEALADLIDNPLARRLLDHPRENRFDHARFQAELRARGFGIVAIRNVGRWFGWYVADREARVRES